MAFDCICTRSVSRRSSFDARQCEVRAERSALRREAKCMTCSFHGLMESPEPRGVVTLCPSLERSDPQHSWLLGPRKDAHPFERNMKRQMRPDRLLDRTMHWSHQLLIGVAQEFNGHMNGGRRHPGDADLIREIAAELRPDVLLKVGQAGTEGGTDLNGQEGPDHGRLRVSAQRRSRSSAACEERWLITDRSP